MSQNRLALVLSDFARTMLTDFPIQGILDELVGRIVELLPITGAGVTLISDGSSPHYVAASSSLALRFERLQTTLSQGPCVLAHSSDAAVAVPDLAADIQFPDFGPQAVAAGLAAVFTFPLRHGDRTLGALDLYRDATGLLEPANMSIAQTLADVASAYLINAQAREDAAASVRRLHHLALHDALTDLPNRTLLQQRLERAAAARRTATTAVLFVDLDRFKAVNDTYGHQVGDDLLIAVARRLSRLIRPGDTLARVSGDEFVLLYENLPTRADVEALAIRVGTAFDEPFDLPRAELQLAMTASIGIAQAGSDQELGNALVEEADLAMYQAKRLGGAGHHVFDLRDAPHLGTRPRLERELRTALTENALELAYQPVIRCTDRVTHGVEALLRWEHPVRGAVAPLSMIIVAEQSGLIVELGEWVLERACRDHGDWVDAHPGVVLDLAVNVSVRQLVSPDYVASVARVLHRTAMDPRRLVLEITENVFLEDSELVTSVVNGIVGLGVRLALDDFGTGYSSLGYLRRLPITSVKIDQTFTTDIDDTSWGGAIIALVTDLAHTLALEVVVEGVETAHHDIEVTALGCDYAQGYFYGTAHDPDAEWVVPERAALANTFREMLLDGADHAVELGWMRDGAELAQRALDADATSERASRALMLAYAGLGETERALREYERCRAVLAEELGIDPSPRTRALHVQLLSVDPMDPGPVPMVGRADELAALAASLDRVVAAGRLEVAYLGGAAGSGRTRLVREAADRCGARLAVVSAADAPQLAERVESAARPAERGPDASSGPGAAPGVVVLVPDAGTLGADGRVALLRRLASTRAAAVVVLLVTASAHAVRERDLRTGGAGVATTFAVQLLALGAEELETLATAVLAGPVTPQLVDRLQTETDGLPGHVTATLTRWSGAGRVVSTAGGLTLASPNTHEGPVPDAPALLLAAMQQLEEDELDVLQLVALLDRPVEPALLERLLGLRPRPAPGATAVRASLDRLVDRHLLVDGPDGHQMRDPVLQQAAHSWLRPNARRRLHAQIASSTDLATAERVRHWRAAGHVQLASAASLDAAEQASTAGDLGAARGHLLVAQELSRHPGLVAAGRAETLERLADVNAALGRPDEAAEQYEQACALPVGEDAERLPRIADKRARLGGQLLRERADLEAAAQAHPPGGPAAPPADPPEDQDVEEALREAVRRADAGSDPAASVRARLRLVKTVLIPARALSEARSLTEAAIGMAPTASLRARSTALRWWPNVLLGNARVAESALDAAWAVSTDGSRLDGLQLLRCLVGHDLGRSDFAERRAQLLASDQSGGPDQWTWAVVRMLTERGSLADALEADLAPPAPDAAPLVRQLRSLARAALLTALHRESEAVSVLLSTITDAEEEGCTLLLPEVTARLVILSAETEPDTALKHFEMFDWVTSAHTGLPREGYLRLLARSAVRAAHGQLDRAAGAAANAARIAEDNGLLLLASEAYLVQAQYLFTGGWTSGGRLATGSAARCQRAAGVAG